MFISAFSNFSNNPAKSFNQNPSPLIYIILYIWSSSSFPIVLQVKLDHPVLLRARILLDFCLWMQWRWRLREREGSWSPSNPLTRPTYSLTHWQTTLLSAPTLRQQLQMFQKRTGRNGIAWFQGEGWRDRFLLNRSARNKNYSFVELSPIPVCRLR